jgi:hypothetical protein
VDRGAVSAGEHVPGVGPVLPSGEAASAFLPLAGGVGAQHPDGVLVQRDDPRARGRLWRALDDLVAGGGPLPDDLQLVLVEVDVRPAQPGGLTTAQPSQGDQPPQREQPLLCCLVEEVGQLLRRPYRHGGSGARLFPVVDPLLGPYECVCPLAGGQLQPAGRVVGDQAFPDRGVQRRPQGGTDVLQRARRRRLPEPVGCLADLGEYRVELAGGQLREPLRAQVRDQEPFHVAGVVQLRRRSDGGAGRQPVPQPPLHRPRIGGALFPRLGQELIPGPLRRGLRLVSAAAHPFRTAQQICDRAVEEPTPVPALGQPRTALAQLTPACRVHAPASLHDHTLAGHPAPP